MAELQSFLQVTRPSMAPMEELKENLLELEHCNNIFTINVCQQSPVIIHSKSSTLIHPEPVDGTRVQNFDLYNSVLGYGKAQGVISITPDPYKPDKFRARVRNTHLHLSSLVDISYS